MIPPREQRIIQQRLEAELGGRVRIDYFTQRPLPVVVPGREECRFCAEVEGALADIAALHPKIALTVHEWSESGADAERLGVNRVPCTVIRGQTNRALRYYGLPGGAQFPVLIEAIVNASKPGAPAVSIEAARKLKRLREPVQISVFVTPTCRYSPAVADAAYRLALANASIRAEVVEISEFPELVERFEVSATPTTVFDGRVAVQGAIDDATLAESASRAADAPATFITVEGGPSTPFDIRALEQQAATDPAAPRIYVPGR